MSQWIGTKEVGLSPSQTSGEVGGQYIERPAGSDVTQTYVPGVGSTSIMIEGGATAGRGGAGVGETTIVRRDAYGNVIGVKQVGQSGETVFERKATPGGGYVEVGLPFAVQSRYATIEQTRAEIPMYRAMATPSQLVAVPSPFQLGQVQYAGGQSPFGQGVIGQRELYPSTPIDYSRTHVSELYSYPLYKGAAFVSRGAQDIFERGVDIYPLPTPHKEAWKGAGSLITGLPEFVASGISGFEYAAREPKVFKEGIVPAGKMFGAGIAEQATERPFYTLGQAAGFVVMMRGGIGKEQPKLLETSKIEPFKAPVRELLPQKPKGMEGLELLKLPEKPGVYKPIVIEGVKSIRESSAIPMQYRAALEKGATPFAERGVMGLQFGSKGYRPTGAAKPENIFTSGEFKRFIKEEKAVSYVPTFERMKAEPQIKPRVQVLTAEKTSVLPSLRNLQVVKTTPKTSFKIAILPKTSTRTARMTDILVQTRPKTLTQTMTRTTTRIALSIKPMAKTRVMPSIMTRVSVMPSVRVKPALKELTQTQTRTAIRTQTKTMFDIEVKKLTKQKIKSPFTNGKLKMKFGHGGFKFPEITRVALPKQIMKGFRL